MRFAIPPAVITREMFVHRHVRTGRTEDVSMYHISSESSRQIEMSVHIYMHVELYLCVICMWIHIFTGCRQCRRPRKLRGGYPVMLCQTRLQP